MIPRTALTAGPRALLARRSLQQSATASIALSRRPFHQTHNRPSQTPTRSSNLLPEFSLQDRVVIVSGGARGVGLTQAEALLEAGAVVHAIDRLPEPAKDSDFARVAERAASELGSRMSYHRVDVRDQAALGAIVGGIADKEGRIDGLIAAAGIQQETPALEYTAEDSDKMMGVNVTGVFMTAQAVAREMIKRKQKGSLVLIGSMSGTVANRGLICP
jgi:NAD(P)-dependent dehydrogenase (short-subunit alcohol dehydrogenase family)